MKCPKCGGLPKVIDVVHTNDNATYRRKKCAGCGRIFYTKETEMEFTDALDEEWRKFYRRKKKGRGNVKD